MEALAKAVGVDHLLLVTAVEEDIVFLFSQVKVDAADGALLRGQAFQDALISCVVKGLKRLKVQVFKYLKFTRKIENVGGRKQIIYRC